VRLFYLPIFYVIINFIKKFIILLFLLILAFITYFVFLKNKIPVTTTEFGSLVQNTEPEIISLVDPKDQNLSYFEKNIVGSWIDYFPSDPNDPTCEFAGDGDCTPNNAEIINFYADHRFSSNNFPPYRLPEDYNCKWNIAKDVVKVNCPPEKLQYDLDIRIVSLTEDQLTFTSAIYTQNEDYSFSQSGYGTEERTFLRNVTKAQ